MYIGHYKSVTSNLEFYSSLKDDLSFPAQVVYEGQRYLLQYTYIVSSKSIHKKITDRATELGIPKDIAVD